jgi:hypothetical protein
MTKSHNRPERERLPRFNAGISVVKKVKLVGFVGGSAGPSLTAQAVVGRRLD